MKLYLMIFLWLGSQFLSHLSLYGMTDSSDSDQEEDLRTAMVRSLQPQEPPTAGEGSGYRVTPEEEASEEHTVVEHPLAGGQGSGSHAASEEPQDGEEASEEEGESAQPASSDQSPEKKKKKKKKRKKKTKSTESSKPVGPKSYLPAGPFHWWNYLDFQSPFYAPSLSPLPENLSSLPLEERLALRDPAAFEEMAERAKSQGGWNPWLPWQFLALTYNMMNWGQGGKLEVNASDDCHQSFIIPNLGSKKAPKNEKDFFHRFSLLREEISRIHKAETLARGTINYNQKLAQLREKNQQAILSEVTVAELRPLNTFEYFCVYIPLLNFISTSGFTFRTLDKKARKFIGDFRNWHFFILQNHPKEHIEEAPDDLYFQLARYSLKAFQPVVNEREWSRVYRFWLCRDSYVKTDLDDTELTPQTRYQRAYNICAPSDLAEAAVLLLEHKEIIPQGYSTPLPNFWERWNYARPFLEETMNIFYISNFFAEGFIERTSFIKRLVDKFWNRDPEILSLANILIQAGIILPQPAKTFQDLLKWTAKSVLQKLKSRPQKRVLFHLYQWGLNQPLENFLEEEPASLPLNREAQIASAITAFEEGGFGENKEDATDLRCLIMEIDSEFDEVSFLERYLVQMREGNFPLVLESSSHYQTCYVYGLINKTFMRDPETLRRFPPEMAETLRRQYFNRYTPRTDKEVGILHLLSRLKGLKSFIETDLDLLKEEKDPAKQTELIGSIKTFGEEIFSYLREGDDMPNIFLTVGVRVRQILNDLRREYPQYFPPSTPAAVAAVSAGAPSSSEAPFEQEEDFSSSSSEIEEEQLREAAAPDVPIFIAPPPAEAVQAVAILPDATMGERLVSLKTEGEDFAKAFEAPASPLASGSQAGQVLRTDSQKERDKLARHRAKLGILLSNKINYETREEEKASDHLSNPQFIWSKLARNQLLSDEAPPHICRTVNKRLGEILNNSFDKGARPELLNGTVAYGSERLPHYSLRLNTRHRLCYSPIQRGDNIAYLIHQCLGHYDD